MCIRDSLYSIGDETKKALKELDKDVTIYQIAQTGYEDKNISSLLKRYKDESKHINICLLYTSAHEISKMQNFFGLNIADQPMTYIKAAFTGGAIILAIAALMIPILSWVTQMLNIKLMPQAAQQDGEQNAMMS